MVLCPFSKCWIQRNPEQFNKLMDLNQPLIAFHPAPALLLLHPCLSWSYRVFNSFFFSCLCFMVAHLGRWGKTWSGGFLFFAQIFVLTYSFNHKVWQTWRRLERNAHFLRLSWGPHPHGEECGRLDTGWGPPGEGFSYSER